MILSFSKNAWEDYLYWQKIDKKISQELSESDKINIKKLINRLSIKEITSFISQNNNVSKKKIYNYCLKLKNEN